MIDTLGGPMQTTTSRFWMAMLVTAFCWGVPTARAGDAVAWLDAVAERPVDHAVMVRNRFASNHEQVTLQGPVAVVSADDTSGAAHWFTAYRIAATAAEPARTVAVGDAAPVRVGPPEFLLVPAKRLADGPAPAAEANAVYEVRPILDVPAADGASSVDRRPTHVGLPVDYRHHFERVPVAEPGRGFILFAAGGANEPAAVAVVDDFGTNRLAPGRTCRGGTWVRVGSGAHD